MKTKRISLFFLTGLLLINIIKLANPVVPYSTHMTMYSGYACYYLPSFTAMEIYTMFNRNPAYMYESEVFAQYDEHNATFEARIDADIEYLESWGINTVVNHPVGTNDEGFRLLDYILSHSELTDYVWMWWRIGANEGAVKPEDSTVWNTTKLNDILTNFGDLLGQMTNASSYPYLASKFSQVATRMPWFTDSDFINNSLVYTTWNSYLENVYETIGALNSTWGGDLDASEDDWGKIVMPQQNFTLGGNTIEDVRSWDFFDLSNELWYNCTKAWSDKAGEYGLKMGWCATHNMMALPSSYYTTGEYWDLELIWYYYKSMVPGLNPDIDFWYMDEILTKDGTPYTVNLYLSMQRSMANVMLWGKYAFWMFEDFWYKGGRADINGTKTQNPGEWSSPLVCYLNHTERNHAPVFGRFSKCYLAKSDYEKTIYVYDYDEFIQASSYTHYPALRMALVEWFPNIQGVANTEINLTGLNQYDSVFFITNDNETVDLMLQYVSQPGKYACWILPNDAFNYSYSLTQIKLRDRHGNKIWQDASIFGASSFGNFSDTAMKYVDYFGWNQTGETCNVDRDGTSTLDMYQVAPTLNYSWNSQTQVFNEIPFRGNYSTIWRVNNTRLYIFGILEGHLWRLISYSMATGENRAENIYAGHQLMQTLLEILGLPFQEHHTYANYLVGWQYADLDNFFHMQYNSYGSNAIKPFDFNGSVVYGSQYKYNGSHLIFGNGTTDYNTVSGWVESWIHPEYIAETDLPITRIRYGTSIFHLETDSVKNGTVKIYCADRGNATDIRGVESWNYNPTTKILTVVSDGTGFIEIWWYPIPWDLSYFFLGLAGIFMFNFSLLYGAYRVKKGDYAEGIGWAVVLAIISIGLIVTWLWV